MADAYQKILVIDDDPLVLRSIQKALVHADFHCETALSADEGVAKARAEDYALIISDIKMPGRTGVEGVNEIRAYLKKQVGKDIPIIFVTGYAEMGQELDAEKHGEIIKKPFDINYLLTTIREYL